MERFNQIIKKENTQESGIVRIHPVEHVVRSLENNIAHFLESRYDLWGVTLDKKENSVIFFSSFFNIIIENAGNVSEYVKGLKQHSDKEVNEGIDGRFVYYSYFYDAIDLFPIQSSHPEKILEKSFSKVRPVGELDFDIASILNSIHTIEPKARVKTRIILGEGIPRVCKDPAFLIFENINGKKVFKLKQAPNITFSVSKNSLIPEEYIIAGEVYECELEKSDRDSYNINVIRRAGKGNFAINYLDEKDAAFKPSAIPDLNDFKGINDLLLITTQSIKKDEKFKDKRMPVFHLTTTIVCDILTSLYSIGFREIKTVLSESPLDSILLTSKSKEGVIATVVLAPRDYINFGFQRG